MKINDEKSTIFIFLIQACNPFIKLFKKKFIKIILFVLVFLFHLRYFYFIFDIFITFYNLF